MARNLSLLVPKPERLANFIRSLAGSEPGLRINTMGEFGELWSKMASKLITGGCTYLSEEVTKRKLELHPLDKCHCFGLSGIKKAWTFII